jgi:hypothetical protein
MTTLPVGAVFSIYNVDNTPRCNGILVATKEWLPDYRLDDLCDISRVRGFLSQQSFMQQDSPEEVAGDNGQIK